MFYSSTFQNVFTLNLWSDGHFRGDSCLSFSLHLCKMPEDSFPLAALGSPRDERWCWRARTSRPDSELFLKLPLFPLVRCYFKVALIVPQKVNPEEAAKQKPGYVLLIISISYPSLCHQVCAVQFRWGLTDNHLLYGWHCACFWLSVSFQSLLNVFSSILKNKKYVFPCRKFITAFHLFVSFCIGNPRVTWPTGTNGTSRR